MVETPGHRPLPLYTPQAPARGAVLIVPSWWGLTASFPHYARLLAREGFAVLISDLFGGGTARTEAEARALKAAPRKAPVYKGLLHDIDTLCGETGAARIGVVGFSMGAHWAVWLSQQRENRVAAVVLYYGARGGDFSGSRAAYLAHFAETDPWVSASSRKGMERAIERAGRPYRAIDHPGTSHWFAETDRRDAYVPKAAERAFAESAAHLARVLG